MEGCPHCSDTHSTNDLLSRDLRLTLRGIAPCHGVITIQLRPNDRTKGLKQVTWPRIGCLGAKVAWSVSFQGGTGKAP